MECIGEKPNTSRVPPQLPEMLDPKADVGDGGLAGSGGRDDIPLVVAAKKRPRLKHGRATTLSKGERKRTRRWTEARALAGKLPCVATVCVASQVEHWVS